MTSANGRDDALHRPERLTLVQAAEALGVSKWTVRRMIDDDELSAIRVRGMFRVDAMSVERYIDEHKYRERT